MRTLIAMAAFALLAACRTTPEPPTVPETVTVVVERYRDMPEWATDPLPTPQPVDGTVGALLDSHEARGSVNGLANCHRRLLRQLDRGEDVRPDACEVPHDR